MYTTLIFFILDEKKRFYENQFKDVSYNSKITWQLINEVACYENYINNKDKIGNIIKD
jgi:hypothetical protein